MLVIGDTRHMRDDATAHVEAIVLWQCACRGRDLPKRDYLHLVACTDCETLANEMKDALNNVEKELARLHPHVGVS